MATKSIDLTKWNEAMKVLEKSRSIFKDQAEGIQSTSRSEELYFELYWKYFERLNRAQREGEDIYGHYTSVPAEIFYAMDVVPMLVQSTLLSLLINVDNYPRNISEYLDIAQSEVGLMLETCSAHRAYDAAFYKGWVPPLKALVCMGGVCDAFSYSNRFPAEKYGWPVFYVDIPYYSDERSIKYLAHQFEGTIHFLEEQTGRKMDWDRLKEVIKRSAEMVKLHKEIAELRKTIPSPMENRFIWVINWFNWIYAGTPEGVNFYKTLRDELRERVKNKIGAAPQERLRIIDLFFPPAYATVKLYNTWQLEHGVSVVHVPATTYGSDWDGDMDPSQPLESLARKWYNGPAMRAFGGPAENYCNDVVKDALDYKVDGAIWFVQNACAQVGYIRPVKDALREKADIPTLVVDCDLLDPSFVPEEEIIQKCEEFFELLEHRKRSQ